MARFMVMIAENEAAELATSPSEMKSLLEAHAAYEQTLREASVYLDGGRLRPSREAKRVGGDKVDDGPFGDEALSSFIVVEAADLDAAMKLAEGCPLPPGAALEVRPLMKGRFDADRSSRQGRIFGYAVLGKNAPNEQSWIAVMDRFDASSRDRVPETRFRGGVRLLEPALGRRVVQQSGGRRAIFDGPFLESKEVIGGLFFMQMTGMDEAVDWAKRSAFAGLVEIRELWRS